MNAIGPIARHERTYARTTAVQKEKMEGSYCNDERK